MNRLTDPFLALTEEATSNLIERLYKSLPDSYHVLCSVLHMVDWKKKVPDLNGNVYAPNGDISDSTCIIVIKFGKSTCCTYYSDSEVGCKRLNEGLRKTSILTDPITDSILVTAVHDRVYRCVGTDWSADQQIRITEVTVCNLYSITPLQAAAFNPTVPDDVEVRNLKEEDAETIDAVWPHRVPGRSVHLIRNAISLFPCFGVYRRSDDKLLSWVLKWFYGGVGVLQTAEEGKRKGYAQVVMKAIISNMVKDSWPIHATVHVTNHPSNRLFQKMGFTNQFPCHYIELNRTPTDNSS